MKKYSLLIISGVLFISLFSSIRVHANLISTFDSGAEGWTVTNGAKNLTWNSSGGNPGGFISAEENLLFDTWFFRSPDSWAGDWTSYIGGKINFDIVDIEKGVWDPAFGGDHGGFYDTKPEVVLVMDANNWIFWNAVFVPPPPNFGDWTTFQLKLLGSNAFLASTSTRFNIPSAFSYCFA